MKPNQNKLRKAAIFVASLDDATADVLLDQMGDEQAALVRRELAALDEIDPEEQRQIIAEFRRAGLAPTTSPPATRPVGIKSGGRTDSGIEVDSSLAAKLARAENLEFGPAPTASASTYSPYSAHEAAPPFRFLHDADCQTLVTFLEREHPQTIALVVSHLAPNQAGEVIDALPTDLQVDVVRRLSELDDTDPEVLREVERGLQGWLAAQLHSRKRKAAGLASVSAILAATGKGTRDQIMSRLAKQDQSLASRLEPARYSTAQHASEPTTLDRADHPASTFSGKADTGITISRMAGFNDLMRANDKALSEVLSSAHSEIVVLALAGAEARFVDRALRCVSAEQARLLCRALAHLGPTRLSDVEDAQQTLADIADEHSRNVKSEGRKRTTPSRVAMAA